MPYPKPPAPIRPQENRWTAGDVPFQNVDEYRERYVQHAIPPRITFKPVHAPIVSGKFVATTENHDEYLAHQVGRREKPKVLLRLFEPATHVFSDPVAQGQ